MSPPTEIEIIIGPHGPEWLLRAMLHLESKVNRLEQRMISMTDQQGHLDNELAAMHQDLTQVIAELKAQAGAAIIDFSGLDSFATRLHQVANPGQPAPAATPAAPTAATTAAAAPGAAPTTATQTPAEATPAGPETTTTGSTAGAVTGDATTQAGAAPTATASTDHPPYYVYGGTDPVATPPWEPIGLETTDNPPKDLYTFQGEVPGQAPTAATADGTTWVVYTGDTQPKSA